MDLLILEVDGSLANPRAAGAVVVWTAVLSAIAIGVALSRGRTMLRVGQVAAFVILLAVTRPAQLAIGQLLYWVTDWRIAGVGFWGGPPVWIAPAVSCGVGLAAWLVSRRCPDNF